MKESESRTTIVGGCGHVGLPLGALLAAKGLRVDLLDIDSAAVNIVNSGRAPFKETGLTTLVDDVVRKGFLVATSDPSVIELSRVVILVTGTPLNASHNPDPDSVLSVVRQLKERFTPEHHVILRSTVYPGTTEAICRELEDVTGKVYFCPERIAEGKALEELEGLPQVVGLTSGSDEKFIMDYFSLLGVKIFATTSEKAELVKLFTNAWRYINFGVSNEMWRLCASLGISFSEIRELMVADYPRGANIATSGLVGGPCLIKDTRQLSHFFGNNFMFANTALAINNSLPKVLIEEISRDHRLERITVGILGLSFKPNLDDVRSSLSIELYELLRLYAKEVLVTDPHVVNFPNNLSTDYVLRNSDLIIIATEHEEFLTIDFSGPVYKFY